MMKHWICLKIVLCTLKVSVTAGKVKVRLMHVLTEVINFRNMKIYNSSRILLVAASQCL